MTLVRFLIVELLALAVLIASLGAGIATRFGTAPFALVFHILPIISAVTMIALAIVFFCQPRRTMRAADPD